MERILITSDGAMLGNINLAPVTVIDEIVQNIAVILATTRGTIPYMRDFGRNARIKDRPINIIKNMVVSDTFQQIRDYEPRAVIDEIRVEESKDEPNGILVTVVLGGIEEDE